MHLEFSSHLTSRAAPPPTASWSYPSYTEVAVYPSRCAVSPWSLINRQKFFRALAGGQLGSTNGYLAIMHHRFIARSIKRCLISGRACIQTTHAGLGEECRAMPRVLATKAFGDKNFNPLSQQFIPLIAEHFLDLRGDQCDLALPIHHHHGIRRGFQEPSKLQKTKSGHAHLRYNQISPQCLDVVTILSRRAGLYNRFVPEARMPMLALTTHFDVSAFIAEFMASSRTSSLMG
jgi:hypothetical protein